MYVAPFTLSEYLALLGRMLKDALFHGTAGGVIDDPAAQNDPSRLTSRISKPAHSLPPLEDSSELKRGPGFAIHSLVSDTNSLRGNPWDAIWKLLEELEAERQRRPHEPHHTCVLCRTRLATLKALLAGLYASRSIQ